MVDKSRIKALLKSKNKAFKQMFYFILVLVVFQIVLSIFSILFRDISVFLIIFQVISGIFLVVFVSIELRSFRKTIKIIYDLINETDDSKFKII